MRHRKKNKKLKRTASHRKATFISLTTALLRHKKIRTTLAKAKAVRPFVEKIITRARNAATSNDKIVGVHERRQVSRFIKDRTILKELFNEIAQKVINRNGGYTRVIKLGQRYGDGAEMAIIELVDFNVGKDTSKSIESTKKKVKTKT